MHLAFGARNAATRTRACRLLTRPHTPVRVSPSRRLQPIQRAPDSRRALGQHVGIGHGGLEIGVPQELLQRADIHSVFEEVCREGMAERVTSGSLRDSYSLHRLFEHFLQRVLVEMVSPRPACARTTRHAI